MMWTEQLTSRIKSTHLLDYASCITMALSGGADSVALLLLLRELQSEYGFALSAVHVHHGIRGAEADRDADFCAQICEKYGIPFQLVRVDVPTFAKEQHHSLETAARILRYEALEKAAPQGLIATAHHAGDQAETMLFHLVRGSGLRGLCGIPPKRGRIIRPLLEIPKENLLAYLNECGQDFVTDSTNLQTDASRNLLRHEVMPLLQNENPQSIPHMARTAALLAEDEALLTAQAQAAFNACLVRDFADGTAFSWLTDYPRPIRMRVYRQAMWGIHDPSYDKLRAIDDILLAGTGKTEITTDCFVQVCRGVLYFVRHAKPPCDDLCVPLDFPAADAYSLFPNKSCRVEMIAADGLSPKIHNSFTKFTFDYDKIIGTPCFRQWKASDRITLPARTFSSSLKACIQAAVPAPERRCLYVLYDDLGCIFCEDVGIAARVKPDAETSRCLRIQILRGEQKKE